MDSASVHEGDPWMWRGERQEMKWRPREGTYEGPPFPFPGSGTTVSHSSAMSLSLLIHTFSVLLAHVLLGNNVSWGGESSYLSGSVVMLRKNQARGSIRSYAWSRNRHIHEHPSLALLFLESCRQEVELHGSPCVANWGLCFAN